jgi:hypothetical protein
MSEIADPIRARARISGQCAKIAHLTTGRTMPQTPLGVAAWVATERFLRFASRLLIAAAVFALAALLVAVVRAPAIEFLPGASLDAAYLPKKSTASNSTSASRHGPSSNTR